MNKCVKKIISISFLVLLTFLTTNSNAAESAKAFGNGDSSRKYGAYIYTYIDDMDFAYGGFEKLGYSASTSRAYYSNIMNWINSSSNNYGLFISTHGPEDGDTSDFFISEEGTKIYPSSISGNWHLVYIDACNSKKNNRKETNNASSRVSISWYPGHMAKTMKQLETDLKLVDVVVEILDARIPVSSQNPEAQKLIKNKKKIKTRKMYSIF